MKDRTYDTKKGIAKSLKSLEGLAALLLKRREAYFRDEWLGVFVILGRYRLDDRGNIEKLETPIKEAHPRVPNVLNSREFREYITCPGNLSYKQAIVAPGLQCSNCGLVWDINNLHEASVLQSCEDVLLDDFAGKTLSEVLDLHNQKRDGLYSFAPAEGMSDKEFIAKPGYSVRFAIVKLIHHDCKSLT